MTTAQSLIDAIHRLATLERFSREMIESVLGTTLYPATGTSPEHVVCTAAFEDGPFASAELIEPGPYSRLVERRLVLSPAGSLSFAEIAGWYGPGTPLQIDGRAEQPLAAIAYDVEGHEVVFSFAIEEGDIRFVTIRRAR
jgi:hypothetical protein